MGDRRRRAVAGGVVGVVLALGLCPLTPAPAARADLADLIDTILNAGAAGLDQAGMALAALSPDEVAAAVVGAADVGLPADTFGEIDQLVANISSQLDDRIRELTEGWGNDLLPVPVDDSTGQLIVDQGGVDGNAIGGNGSFLFGGDADANPAAAAPPGGTTGADGPGDGQSGALDGTGTPPGGGDSGPDNAGSSDNPNGDNANGDNANGDNANGGNANGGNANGDNANSGAASNPGTGSSSVPRISPPAVPRIPGSGGSNRGNGARNRNGANGLPAP